MTKTKMLSVSVILGAVLAAFNAQAAKVTDAHGNTGYDTAAECDAAVLSGTAKPYVSFTHKPSLLRAGEAQVREAKLSDVSPEYRAGACDVGAAHSFSRDGVSRALQGKYIPVSPNMPVNVYFNKNGQPVRVTMKQCDNNFSGPRPRPVAIPAPVVVAPKPYIAPVVAAPVVVAAAQKGLTPYVFGTLGALRDKVKYNSGSTNLISDSHIEAAGQFGAGLQFNNLVGAELFYQGTGEEHDFRAVNGSKVKIGNHTYGARVTLGGTVAKNTRVFAKLGAARVKHEFDAIGYKNSQTRFTAGVGATTALTKHLDLRADYDHYFKRGSNNPSFRSADYLGLGLQYNF